jgi:WD40 repeat protein
MRGYTLGKWMVSAILATLTLHGKAQERPDIVWMRGWHLGAVNFVSFSSDGQYLISASADRTAKIWRVSDENLVRTFVGHSSGVNCAVFSPDGNYAATGDQNTLRVWRLSDGRLLHAISGTTYDIDFSHNSAWVARGGYGYSVWRVDNGTLVRTFGSASYWK